MVHLLRVGIIRQLKAKAWPTQGVYIQGHLLLTAEGELIPAEWLNAAKCDVLPQMNNPVKGTNVLQKRRRRRACFLLTDIHL